jgi:hypothetical protein
MQSCKKFFFFFIFFFLSFIQDFVRRRVEDGDDNEEEEKKEEEEDEGTKKEEEQDGGRRDRYTGRRGRLNANAFVRTQTLPPAQPKTGTVGFNAGAGAGGGGGKWGSNNAGAGPGGVGVGGNNNTGAHAGGVGVGGGGYWKGVEEIEEKLKKIEREGLPTEKCKDLFDLIKKHPELLAYSHMTAEERAEANVAIGRWYNARVASQNRGGGDEQGDAHTEGNATLEEKASNVVTDSGSGAEEGVEHAGEAEVGERGRLNANAFVRTQTLPPAQPKTGTVGFAHPPTRAYTRKYGLAQDPVGVEPSSRARRRQRTRTFSSLAEAGQVPTTDVCAHACVYTTVCVCVCVSCMSVRVQISAGIVEVL